MLLCAATGSSPTGTYHFLSEEYEKTPSIFDELRIIKLDEWGGVDLNHPATCETYLQTHLLKPLNITRDRYTGFDSNSMDAVKECQRIQEKLNNELPIDLCILGLGINGHIAFNEPDDYLAPHCHVAKLSESSLSHPMTNHPGVKPTYGLTLGMADILNSRTILLLVHGSQKKPVFENFLSKRITTAIPASFLWLHSNVICLTTEDLMDNHRFNS